MTTGLTVTHLPSREQTRLIVWVGLAVTLIAAVAAYLLSRGDRSTPVVRGSSTIEFVTPRATPGSPTGTRSLTPWPTYGYDRSRTHVALATIAPRPPYRKLWARRIHNWVEFPRSAAYGNVYVGRLDGVVYAFDGGTGAQVWARSFRP